MVGGWVGGWVLQRAGAAEAQLTVRVISIASSPKMAGPRFQICPGRQLGMPGKPGPALEIVGTTHPKCMAAPFLKLKPKPSPRPNLPKASSPSPDATPMPRSSHA